VVRGAKGTTDEDRTAAREQARDRVYCRHLERLVIMERRKDRRQATGEHGLPGTGRPNEQARVPAGSRDLERALCALLADDVGKVRRVGKRTIGRRSLGFRQRAAAQPRNQLGERRGRRQADTSHERRLRQVRGREHQNRSPPAPRRPPCDRQGAADTTHRTVETELAEDHQPREGFGG
jgi:hypothetical protein